MYYYPIYYLSNNFTATIPHSSPPPIEWFPSPPYTNTTTPPTGQQGTLHLPHLVASTPINISNFHDEPMAKPYNNMQLCTGPSASPDSQQEVYCVYGHCCTCQFYMYLCTITLYLKIALVHLSILPLVHCTCRFHM